MGKKLLLALVFILSLTVFGCGGSSSGSSDNGSSVPAKYSIDTIFKGIRLWTNDKSEILVSNTYSHSAILGSAVSGSDVYSIGRTILWINGETDESITAMMDQRSEDYYFTSITANDGKVYVAGDSDAEAFLIEINGAERNFIDIHSAITGAITSYVFTVTADSEGNVYVAGGYYDGISKALLVKVNVSGTIQPIDIHSVITGAMTSSVNAVAIDSNGNVYAVGEYYEGGNTKVFLVKSDGITAPQFIDINSVITGAIASSVNAVAIDSNGNVYTAGIYYDGGNNKAFLVKSDGIAAPQSIDIHSVITGAITSSANAVAIDSNGNVYTAGGYYDGVSTKAFLVKSDGIAAPQFTDIHSMLPDSPSRSSINSIAIDDNGIFAYMTGDKADSADNVEGFLTAINLSTMSLASSAVLPGDSVNSLIAANSLIYISGSDDDKPLLITYSGTSLEERIPVEIPEYCLISPRAYSVETATDGTLYIAGAENSHAVLIKKTKKGNIEFIDLHSLITPASYSSVYSVSADSRGNVYLAGNYEDGTRKPLLVKVDGSGTPQLIDTSNIISGAVITSLFDITTDNSGNAYVTGEYSDINNPADLRAFLIKVDINGTVQLLVDINSLIPEESHARPVKIDRDGNVYMAGYYNDGINKAFLVKVDGSGIAQLIELPDVITANGDSYIYAVTTGSDGNVYAAGNYNDGSVNKAFLVKVSESGTTAESISLPEEITTADNSEAFAVAVNAEGKIYVGGYYKPDSSADSTAFLIEITGESAEIQTLYIPGNSKYIGKIIADSSGNMYLLFDSII